MIRPVFTERAPSLYQVLIVLGLLVGSLHVLFTIGIILLVLGLILNSVPIGGTRRRYY